MSPKSMVLLFLFTFMPISAIFSEESKNTKSESEMFLDKVSGVYKKKFKNGLVDGSSYESEDILEVVPVDAKSAYVRMKLEFFNGHQGDIYGVAQYVKDSLLLDVSTTPESRCVVELIWSQDKVLSKANYEKTPGCNEFHGARGSLDEVDFALSARRNIKYLKRLKNSPQFKDAVDRFGKKAK